MSTFIADVEDQLQVWIDNNELEFSDLAFIMRATGHNESIREQLEQFILQKFLNLTIH